MESIAKNLLTADRNAQPEIFDWARPGLFQCGTGAVDRPRGPHLQVAQEAAERLGLPGFVIAGNPLLGTEHPPSRHVIEIRGEIDKGLRDTLDRQIERADLQREGQLPHLRIETVTGGHGAIDSAVKIAQRIRGWNDRVLTIAYIANRTQRPDTAAFGCSQIVMAPGSCWAIVEQLRLPREGSPFLRR